MNVRNLVVGLAMLLFTGSSMAQSFGQNRPANVVLQPMAFSPVTVSIDTVGTAEARKSVSIYSAVGDKVTEVLFQPGDYVERDQVLLKLDARRQIIALERAQIELTDAERTLKRILESKQKGAATQSDVDDALTQRDLAKVAVQEAKTNLEDRTVLAPFAGIVGLTNIEPGDRIDTNTLITSIDDRKQLFVNFDAPESALELLSQDKPVSLQPWNNRDIQLSATIAQIDSRVNVQDRTLRVRAILDNQHDRFRPGLSFRVSLNLDGESYPIVPEAALAWGATSAHVWVAREGKANKEQVTIKQRLRGQILVEGNLQPDDALIVEGIQLLRPGQQVKPATMLSQAASN